MKGGTSQIPKWQIFNRAPNAQAIADGLKDIPEDWSLTPIQDKAAKRDGWQEEPFIPHSTIAEFILKGERKISKKSGKEYSVFASGFGLRTGEQSGGKIAIDIDGPSAEPILQRMSGGILPQTPGWTSGKPGRRQIVFQVPEEIRPLLTGFNRAVVTEFEDLKTAAGELLEFRYNNHQSCLPPSRHPQTGAYNWIDSPVDTPVAIAPQWLCDKLVELANQERQDSERRQQQAEEHQRQAEERRRQRHLNIIGATSLQDVLEESLNRLNAQDIYNWSGHNWHYQGNTLQGCCPRHQSTSGKSFHVDTKTLEWFCFGCNVGGGPTQYRFFAQGGTGNPTGRNFVEVLRGLASDAGVQMPELPQPKHDSQSLSVEARDCNIRKLAAQVGLTSRHRQDLRDRGLTDAQIDAGKFFSISPWQEVSGIDSRLPGVDLWGKRLAIPYGGIGCPVWDNEGRIIGFQVRLDDVAEGKYRWATSKTKKRPNGTTSHLQNGELPISCCRPLGEVTRSSIGLAEGFIKTFVASQKLGQIVIGAAGGNFASSPQQLRTYLDTLSLELDTKLVDLYPDAGSTSNPSVMGQYDRVIKLVQSWGYTVRIAWWGQLDKTGQDIDELENLETIAYFSPEEFWEKVDRERYDREVAAAQKKLNTLSYKVDVLLDAEYLPGNLWSKIPDSGIVNIKARKGGGKSTLIKNLIQTYKAKGRRVLSITPRIALGREQAFKWDITWIDECGVEGNYSLSVKLQSQEEALGLCWDSLWKITDQDWSGATIIIDEAELGVKHLASSSTCSDRRASIMVGFGQLLHKVLSSGGLVLLSDADLTDISVDYVKSFAPGDVPVFTVINTNTGEPWEVDLYLGKRGVTEDQILSNVDNDLKVAVATDSQREAEALERKIIEKHPTKKIIRIDRRTCQEDLGRNFVKDSNGSIQRLQPDVLIYTPSMGTGVSIDGYYFDEVVGLFFGVIEPSEAAQMMARVRDTTIPRSAWAKDANYDSPGCKSPLPSVVKKQLFKFHNTTADLLSLASALSESDDDMAALATLNRLFDKQKQEWQSPHIDLYANVKARRNFGLSQFALQFYQQMLDDGHDVRVFEGETTAFSEEVAITKEVLKLEEAEAISKAEKIDVDLAKLILNNPNSKEEERHKAVRAMLADSLPGIDLTQDFIYKATVADKGRWLAHHKLYWMLSNPDKVQILDKRQWHWHLQKLQVFLPDIHTYSLQVKVLRDLGVLDLIDTEREFSAPDDDVKRFLDRAIFNRYRIKTAFDLTVTPKSNPILLLMRLLERIGLGLAYSRREGPRGKEVRYYRIPEGILTDPDRLAVLAALDQKYQDLVDTIGAKRKPTPAPTAESAAQDYTPNPVNLNEKSRRHNSPININQREVVATKNQPLEAPLNKENHPLLATENEAGSQVSNVPVAPDDVPVFWGIGLVNPGVIVECLGKVGQWIVKYCTGDVAKIVDFYGDEQYASCKNLRLISA